MYDEWTDIFKNAQRYSLALLIGLNSVSFLHKDGEEFSLWNVDFE